MIQIEANKINHVEYIRMYSDTNRYLKLPNSDELLTEVMTLGKDPLDVIETDTPIESPPEPPQGIEPDPWAELLDKVNALTIIASKQVDDLTLSEAEREEVGRVFELKPGKDLGGRT